MYGAILFLTGFAVLIAGAELVIRGGTRVAVLLGISPLVLGLTVVAVGTSLPELAVGIIASRQGNGDLAIGNIAGTNIFNILFIFGLSACMRPLPVHLRVLRLDLPMMIAAAVVMTFMACDHILTSLDGLLMFLAAVFYTIGVVRLSRGESVAVKAEFAEMYRTPEKNSKNFTIAGSKYGVMLLIGMGLSVLGADWLVSGAVSIAHALGISDALIGLTIVAIGTSAPELATTIVATLKDERDVAIGNLLGSCIYNIFVILGLTTLASPGGLPVGQALLKFDIPMMVGVMLLCVPVFKTDKLVSRTEGIIFITFYLIYLSSLILFRT
jgi:cation:H+ antiporter